MPADPPHPDKVAACREVLRQLLDDADDLADTEVIRLAETVVDPTAGRVAEEHDLPLQPDHLPTLPSLEVDAAILQAELLRALQVGSTD